VLPLLDNHHKTFFTNNFYKNLSRSLKRPEEDEASSINQYKTGQEEFTFVHGMVFTSCQMGYSKAVFAAASPHVKRSQARVVHYL
jgi:hypothetical protein